MATPAIFADGTQLSAANLNKFINAEGKAQVKINYAYIYYNGTAWLVSASWDSAGSFTFTWDATNGQLVVGGISGYTIGMMALAAKHYAGYIPGLYAKGTSPYDEVYVIFYDFTGTKITTQDTGMKFNLLIIGT